MKKKLLAVALVAAMAMGLMACGGGSSSGSSDAAAGDAAKTEEAAAPAASGEGDIRLVNGKIEVDAALKAAAEAYKAETGVTVAIESMGGGVNIQDTLKGYFQADNMPDIFVCGSDADFGNWTGKLADLSNEPWAADTDAGYKDADGKIIGFPYTTEAIGLAYNADILEKAGIDPASITGPESMKAAFETLDAKKDELGLTRICTGPPAPTALQTTLMQVSPETTPHTAICSLTAVRSILHVSSTMQRWSHCSTSIPIPLFLLPELMISRSSASHPASMRS